MNYYPHHIGDYAAHTRHLSLLEHGVYRTMLDLYYLSEKPLPADHDSLCRKIGARTKEEKEAVRAVGNEFFYFDGEILRQTRCDEELIAYQNMVQANINNGKKGGRPRKFLAEEEKPKPNPKITGGLAKTNRNLTQNKPKPKATKNQEPRTKEKLPVQDKDSTQVVSVVKGNGHAHF